jgi:hypothetical protein
VRRNLKKITSQKKTPERGLKNSKSDRDITASLKKRRTSKYNPRQLKYSGMFKTLKDTPAVNIEANKTCMHERTNLMTMKNDYMHTERLQKNVTVRK